MRSQFPFGLLAAVAIVATGTGIATYAQFVRPNIGSWTTQDLMNDLNQTTAAHGNDPYPFSLVCAERQRYVAEEFSRRTPIWVGQLQRQEAAESLTCQNRILSLASTGGPRP